VSATSDGPGAGRHLGDLAELHALGALEPDERAFVEAHVASCARCGEALGAAEATVAALDEAFVPLVAPPERLGERIAASAGVALVRPLAPQRAVRRSVSPSVRALATAAALAFAVGIGGSALVERNADVREAGRQSAILATIANSHFNHVGFMARTAAAPVGKVLYARDGSWFYVIVDGVTCDCRVIARSAGGERDLGKLQVRGSTATLFVRDVPQPASLELVDATGKVVSAANLRYAAP